MDGLEYTINGKNPRTIIKNAIKALPEDKQDLLKFFLQKSQADENARYPNNPTEFYDFLNQISNSATKDPNQVGI
jgi:hypothetical protein